MLQGKTIIITGGARRLGREFALAVAKNGADLIIHHNNSPKEAEQTAKDVIRMGRTAEVIRADFSDPQGSLNLFRQKFSTTNLFALVHNAAVFKSIKFIDTTYDDWQRHMDINLTMPFMLSQLFAESLGNNKGKIINILDWRALRPGYDHFPYTISKSALAGMTKSMALALAPKIQVNGIALGAILPPSGGSENNIISKVPAGRWSTIKELTDTLLFLLNGPEYVTGEIIHLDGGRHLI